MRKVPVSLLKPGARVARSVLAPNGGVLLRTGVVLSPRYLRNLEALGIPTVYIVDDDQDLEVPVDDVVSEETRVRATVTVREFMEAARNDIGKGKPGRMITLDDEKVRSVVRDLVDELLSNQDLLVNLSDIRILENFVFVHSVQVAVLSIMTGINLHYDTGKLRDLGTGAILHDIGKIRIPESIVNKPGALSPDEYDEMKKHSERGFEILRRQPGISIISAHVAYQHHEKFNGEGYPRKLKGDEILEFAKIAAIADSYDAITSDRPYRRGLPPHEAAEMISGGGNYFFDHRIAQSFLGNIALYPVGSLVELSNRYRGVVCGVKKGLASRPRIRLVWDPEGGRLNPPEEIELSDNPALVITRTFDDPSQAQATRRQRPGQPASSGFAAMLKR